ncbi:hypothetical protein BGZ63DRAFT_372050 [Mariannaea sp. PMI_226]|nr:hypothetical protein BGZ63DRAFT_372050 [Mariannaea sp. PMI_226]
MKTTPRKRFTATVRVYAHRQICPRLKYLTFRIACNESVPAVAEPWETDRLLGKGVCSIPSWPVTSWILFRLLLLKKGKLRPIRSQGDSYLFKVDYSSEVMHGSPSIVIHPAPKIFCHQAGRDRTSRRQHPPFHSFLNRLMRNYVKWAPLMYVLSLMWQTEKLACAAMQLSRHFTS